MLSYRFSVSPFRTITSVALAQLFNVPHPSLTRVIDKIKAENNFLNSNYFDDDVYHLTKDNFVLISREFEEKKYEINICLKAFGE